MFPRKLARLFSATGPGLIPAASRRDRVTGRALSTVAGFVATGKYTVALTAQRKRPAAMNTDGQPSVGKDVLTLLVQCNRLAPALTPIQIAIMLVLFNAQTAMTREDIAVKLHTTKNQVKGNCRYMLAKNGQDVVSLDDDDQLSLTKLGERYCRQLITNTKHFLEDG
ncbi:MAG: hypothetical protein ACR2PT_23710 [Endozoicomonas sp.]